MPTGTQPNRGRKPTPKTAATAPSLRVAPSTMTRALAIGVGEGDALPSEFRLFVRGWNDTENGRFLFDDAAAAATMAAYRDWGVDLMIDLEHQALEPGIPVEPTARDARGWCRLELREDGSLWAVNVTWTKDGAERLREKRQRYISPAFSVDEESRVVSILNIAITAIPATHDTPALVAARSNGKRPAKLAALGGRTMNQKTTAAALDAVANKDAKAALVVLQQILGELLGMSGDESPASSSEPPAGGDPTAASATGAATEDAPPDGGAKKASVSLEAMGTVASALTGITEPTAALAELARRNRAAVDLEQREQKLSSDRASLEATERRGLVAALVKLGVELPATAWADDKGTVPVARLANEPIADLQKRVAVLSAAKGQKPTVASAATGTSAEGIRPPATSDVCGLDERELQICKDYGCEPAMFARLKSERARAVGTKKEEV